MESSLPSGYGQVLRIFRQGFSPWAERSTDDTCSNWTTGRYNSEEMKATDMRTGQAADHRSKSQGLSVHWNCPLPRVVASGTTISLAAAMHNRCRVRVKPRPHLQPLHVRSRQLRTSRRMALCCGGPQHEIAAR